MNLTRVTSGLVAAAVLVITISLLLFAYDGRGGVATAATVYVSPTGNDAGACTQVAPCGTFNRSYKAAGLGGTVIVNDGIYTNGQADIADDPAMRGLSPGCNPYGEFNQASSTANCVEFKPAAGANITISGEWDISASNVWIHGTVTGGNNGSGPDFRSRTYTWKTTSMAVVLAVPGVQPEHVIMEGVQTKAMTSLGVKNFEAKNVQVGPSTVDSPGGGICSVDQAKLGARQGFTATNVVWDGVFIVLQDRTLAAAQNNCHPGGLFMTGGINGFTMKNSACSQVDVYCILAQDFGGSGPMDNVTIENNWFGCNIGDDYASGGGKDVNVCKGGFSIEFDSASGGTNWLIRYNSLEDKIRCVSNCSAFTNVRVVGNTGGGAESAACGMSGVTWLYNAFLANCSGTGNITLSTLPWIRFDSPGFEDFHLASDSSTPNNLVSPTTSDYNIGSDFDNQSRSAPREAGADEFVGTAQTFDWNTCYQSTPLGGTCLVPGGTYSSQTILWRSDTVNKTPSGAEPSSSQCVNFVMNGNVVIDGYLSVRGSAVCIRGVRTQSQPYPVDNATYNLTVKGYVATETLSEFQHPDHVLFQGIDAVSFGAFNSDTVIFRNMDVGPATVSSGCGIIQGPGFENKIAYGNGITNYVDKSITIDNSLIHDQNGDAGRIASDCHFGGLFVVSVDGLTIKDSVFKANVVYHQQFQNFSGPQPTNVLIDHNSFSCTADWLYNGNQCGNGGTPIQFNASNVWTNITISNNLVANGSSGLFRCQVPNCDISQVVSFNNQDYPASLVAPDLNGSPPPPPPPPSDTQPPSVPQGLQQTARTETSIAISWNASTDNVGVVGYKLYKDGIFVQTTTNLNYDFTGLNCGTSYDLGVTAYDAAGNESNLAEAITTGSTLACSTVDTQAPTTPPNFRRTTGTKTTVTLGWNASTDNIAVTGYKLYRGDGTYLQTYIASARTAKRSGLVCKDANGNPNTYTYQLTAIDAAGNESPKTPILSVTCDPKF